MHSLPILLLASALAWSADNAAPAVKTPAALTPATGVSATPQESESLKLFARLEEVIVQVSSRVKPWVVHIEAVQKRGDQKYKVIGSGLILGNGNIVTNHHIVDEATLITVTFPDGSRLDATLVGSDRQTDIALIRTRVAAGLPEPSLGDSSAVSVGEWIIAVGNPYGFDRTVYFGIVSGMGRTLASLNSYQDVDSGFDFTTDFIQTDASIDPGSSGGPLVNLRGEVIGINSMGLGRGMSFTIPINTAREVVRKLMTEGKLARGWAGISIQPMTREMTAYFGSGTGGILVSEVTEGSPADRAGLRQGDIIQEFNGTPVSAENEEELNRFSRLIWGRDVGSRVWLRVRRGTKILTMGLTIGEQPRLKAREVETAWGFNVKEITPDIFRDYLLDNREGVLVSFVEAGTAGGEGRLKEGDVIRSIDGTPVRNLADFERQYGALKAKDPNVMFLVKRRKDWVYLLLEVGKFTRKPRS
jgi:serine protease Do